METIAERSDELGTQRAFGTLDPDELGASTTARGQGLTPDGGPPGSLAEQRVELAELYSPQLGVVLLEQR